MYLCFGFKILLGTKYNGRSMVCAGLLYFVARWVYFNGQNIWWLGLCVALLAAKGVPLRRVMKAFLACGVPTLALVELLHFAGIIAPDAASERNGSYRLMFGYGHPNTFGGVMFGLLLAWVLLRRARLTWPELAGVAAVGVFLMVGPKSRSAALCTFLLVLLLALAKLRTRRGLHPGSRPLAALCAATVPVLAAVSYILTAVRRKKARAVGQRHRPRLAEEARRPADLPHLAGMGGIPGVRHKNCGPDAPGLARAGQYFCVFALPDRPRDGRAGLRADDDGAVRLCPTRAVAGRGLPSGHAGLWLHGEPSHPPDQRPRSAAALRRGVCAAAGTVVGRIKGSRRKAPRADMESAPTACARTSNARPRSVHSVYSSG